MKCYVSYLVCACRQHLSVFIVCVINRRRPSASNERADNSLFRNRYENIDNSKTVVVLTVYDHSLDHEIFIVVSRHDASVVAGQFDGRVDDVQGPAHEKFEIGIRRSPICVPLSDGYSLPARIFDGTYIFRAGETIGISVHSYRSRNDRDFPSRNEQFPRA